MVVHDTSGVLQLHAWDRDTGALRQLTDDPVGVTDGAIDHLGETVYYMHAPDGSEIGHLLAVPWAGGPAVDLTPTWDAYHGYGVVAAGAADVIAFTIAGDDHFRFLVLEEGAPPRDLGRLDDASSTRCLSSDGRIVYVQTYGGPGSPDFGAVAFDMVTGATLGILDDGPGVGLEVHVPAPGTDDRIAASTTQSGVRRPFLWSPRTGTRTSIRVDADGDVVPVAWSPDGAHLVLTNINEARQRLFVADVTSGSVREVPIRGGTTGPGVGYPGVDEFGFGFDHLDRLVTTHSSFSIPPSISAFDLTTGAQTSLLAGGVTPAGRSVRSVSFPSRDGTTVQSWLATPDGDGPYPDGPLHPRRPDDGGARSVVAAGTGVAGPWVRLDVGQLPRLDDIRPRLPDGRHRPRRRAGGRRHGRGPRLGGRAGHRAAGPGLRNRLVHGWLPDTPGPGDRSRPVGGGHGRHRLRRLHDPIRG